LKRLVTAEEMRTIDRRTLSEAGVPGTTLMENAGAATDSLPPGCFSGMDSTSKPPFFRTARA
jgi:NAD(P)H-hydrate repair Nnr-like enzyme with NAD(P)H-hydrate epimerase domain